MSGQMTVRCQYRFSNDCVCDSRVEEAYVAIIHRDASGQVSPAGAVPAQHYRLCGKDCGQGAAVHPITVGHFLAVLATWRQHRDHRRSGVQRQLVQQRY